MNINETERNKKVNEMVERSMRNLNEMVDGNTVIGTPILTASGCQVIPVSKLTMGYLSGGSDIGETKVVKENESVPFAGGSGAVVSSLRDLFWTTGTDAAISMREKIRSIT